MAADYHHSTFHWEIKLDGKNPLNKGAYEFKGYSKEVGRNEHRDKTQLLFNCILRIHKAGYFEKMEYWKIYKRLGVFCNKDTDKLFLQLRSKDYWIAQCETTDESAVKAYHRIVNWLTELYEKRNGNKPIDLQTKKDSVSIDDLLDYKKVKLNSLRETFAYMEKLHKCGASFGQIKHFEVMFLQHNPQLTSKFK